MALVLSSCTSAPQIQPQCLPMVEYSGPQQAELALALAQLSSGSPLVRALRDYEAIRDANRACRSSAP